MSSYHYSTISMAVASPRPGEELADDDRDVAVLDVSGVVHRAHVGGRHPAGQPLERGAQLWIAQQRAGARDGGGVVRRKIMPVVLELKQVQPLDEPGRRVAGDHVHLP